MIWGTEIFRHCIDSSEVIPMSIRSSIRCTVTALCMMMLILDSRTGLEGAKIGIDICIKTLVPSLFPFFILSILLTDTLLGQSLKVLQPIATLCRLPRGSESLLAIGFLGGYPVGAQNVSFAYRQGAVSLSDAQRMVVFCNNAGPAFLFGFLGQIFQNPLCPWILWLIHIISALAVGFLIPGGKQETSAGIPSSQIRISDALAKSVHVMAQVCAWVVLFRIMLQFLQRWIFCFIPGGAQLLITGFLELANGCLLLQNLSSDGLKFVLSALMLGFGGICVTLQTCSVSVPLSLHLYIPGKILQGCISFLLSYGVQFAFLAESKCVISSVLIIVVLFLATLTAVILRNIEKPVAFSGKILYNKKSCEKGRIPCCSGKKSKNPVTTVPMVPN